MEMVGWTQVFREKSSHTEWIWYVGKHFYYCNNIQKFCKLFEEKKYQSFYSFMRTEFWLCDIQSQEQA